MLKIYMWDPDNTNKIGGSSKLGSNKMGSSTIAAVNKYIAAVDENGNFEVGHVALELTPNVYISHYPQTGLDITLAQDPNQSLEKTKQDVPGKFVSSLDYDKGKCGDNYKELTFYNLNEQKVKSYWDSYKGNTVYNLQKRNCATAVALALDAGFELPSIDKMFSKHLWYAAFVVGAADKFLWTPGLAWDFAECLYKLLDE